MDWKIRPADRIAGEIIVPPDKSISHRAIMFGAIANGKITVNNFLPGEDCVSTLEAFKAFGVDIKRRDESTVIITGAGLRGLKAAEGEVYLGNSGTSMRIIPGIISGQGFEAVFTGDPSLSRRPMRRIIEPLRAMGATIEGDNGTDHAPLRVKGRYPLTCGDHNINVASAQVKSCILSAGLYAGGVTSVTEPFRSRDHTERMLKYFSADIKVEGLKVSVRGQKELVSKDICVPGDISSAAFFIVAGLIVDGPGILLRNVGINETRRGVIDVLKRMGADIEIRDVRGELEPVCDLFVKRSELKGTVVRKEEIPLLIDEIPVLTVAASVASGETVINDIGELKVKETDRVKSMMHNLAIAGASSREEGSSLIIEGGTRSFRAAKFESFGDHRTAMSMAIAALISEGESLIADTACVGTSYPRFLADLERITTK